MRITFDIPNQAATDLGLDAAGIAQQCKGWLLGRHQIVCAEVKRTEVDAAVDQAREDAAKVWSA